LPFQLFKGYAYEGGITVPTIVRYPAGLGAGRIVPLPAHVTDIAPTLLQLAGVGHPDQAEGHKVAPLQGRSLLPWLRGQTPSEAPRFDKGWELFGQKAYRQGDWKIVYSVPPFGPGDWQLFNLRTDRAEQANLALQHPEKVAELKTAYAAYAHRNGVLNVPRLAERIAERYSSTAYFDSLRKADDIGLVP
jgi:arylsulfatase